MVRDELLTWADLSSEWPEVESSRVVYDVVTLEGADALLQTVPLVIGMSDTIGDTAAIVFARSFYAALASAQSVATALEQAKMQMHGRDVLPLPPLGQLGSFCTMSSTRALASPKSIWVLSLKNSGFCTPA